MSNTFTPAPAAAEAVEMAPTDSVDYGKHGELTYQQLWDQEPEYCLWTVNKFQELVKEGEELATKYVVGDSKMKRLVQWITEVDEKRQAIAPEFECDSDMEQVEVFKPENATLAQRCDKLRAEKAAAKFYGVASPEEHAGIYTSWEECKPHVVGVKGVRFKSFPSEDAAQEYVRNPPPRALRPSETPEAIAAREQAKVAKEEAKEVKAAQVQAAKDGAKAAKEAKMQEAREAREKAKAEAKAAKAAEAVKAAETKAAKAAEAQAAKAPEAKAAKAAEGKATKAAEAVKAAEEQAAQAAEAATAAAKAKAGKAAEAKAKKRGAKAGIAAPETKPDDQQAKRPRKASKTEDAKEQQPKADGKPVIKKLKAGSKKLGAAPEADGKPKAGSEAMKLRRAACKAKTKAKAKAKMALAKAKAKAKAKAAEARAAAKAAAKSEASAAKERASKEASTDDKKPDLKSSPSVPISEQVMNRAKEVGMTSALQNLAVRAEIISQGLTAENLLDALIKAEGLVNKAKNALLSPNLQTDPISPAPLERPSPLVSPEKSQQERQERQEKEDQEGLAKMLSGLSATLRLVATPVMKADVEMKPATNPGLTDDQVQRIKENRERALARKAMVN